MIINPVPFRLWVIILQKLWDQYYPGAPNRGGGGVGGGSQPPLNFGWGVEHLLTPPDFGKIFLGGVGSP